jgi:protein-L-isoaspartate O-methyltransferase
MILLIFIIVLIVGFVLSYFFLIPFFFGAPYEPSRGKALENIIKFSEPKKGDLIAELGSGDGRICIGLGKLGAEVHGFELNPFLVWFSRRKIRKKDLKNVKIYWKNFWKVDLGEYNKIVVFQFKTVADKLGRKFSKELKPGTKIISHWWRLPGWKVIKKVGRVYFYEKR